MDAYTYWSNGYASYTHKYYLFFSLHAVVGIILININKQKRSEKETNMKVTVKDDEGRITMVETSSKDAFALKVVARMIERGDCGNGTPKTLTTRYRLVKVFFISRIDTLRTSYVRSFAG